VAAAVTLLADWRLLLLLAWKDSHRRLLRSMLPSPHKKQQQVLQCSSQSHQLAECQQLLLLSC
jgi:hypothetical protein